MERKNVGGRNVPFTRFYKVWEIAVVSAGPTFATGHTPAATLAETLNETEFADAFAAMVMGV